MSMNPLLSSLAKGLTSVRDSTQEDLKNIVTSFNHSRNVITKSTDPVELWTAGVNIASLHPQPVAQLTVPEIASLIRGSAAKVPTSVQKPPLAPVQPTPHALKKAVSFNPEVQAVAFVPDPKPAPVSATPQSVAKVRNMLSVWEDKIQRVTTPHYGKTPMSTLHEESSDPQSGLKRKQMDISASETTLKAVVETLNASFDGPILEIPDDLLAELEGLEPEVRQERLSVIKLDLEEKRKSLSKQNTRDALPSPQPAEEQAAPLTGRVAAALKLFKGTTMPKRDFGLVSFAPAKKTFEPKAQSVFQVLSEQMDMDEALDGVALEEVGSKSEPIKFYDAHEKGVIDIDFDDDKELDMEVSQLHAAEAAKEVAKEEAAAEELERSTWLADIEEIRIVSTPAKGKAENTADWSVVTQKMNLSCHLTPVVPGRRSCVVVKPKMLPLAEKEDEDQYEITDKDTDSENELSPASRAKKHIPAWCVNWRQKAIAQIAVDPESIFGLTVPKCDLDVIFNEKNYREMGLHRPKRVRGSSGNWTFDKLTQDEVDRYRAKLGQVVKAEGVFAHQ